MYFKDLINWKNVSLFLSKNDNSIRKKNVPKKYKEKINDLEGLVTYWINKNN